MHPRWQYNCTSVICQSLSVSLANYRGGTLKYKIGMQPYVTPPKFVYRYTNTKKTHKKTGCKKLKWRNLGDFKICTFTLKICPKMTII